MQNSSQELITQKESSIFNRSNSNFRINRKSVESSKQNSNNHTGSNLEITKKIINTNNLHLPPQYTKRQVIRRNKSKSGTFIDNSDICQGKTKSNIDEIANKTDINFTKFLEKDIKKMYIRHPPAPKLRSDQRSTTNMRTRYYQSSKDEVTTDTRDTSKSKSTRKVEKSSYEQKEAQVGPENFEISHDKYKNLIEQFDKNYDKSYIEYLMRKRPSNVDPLVGIKVSKNQRSKLVGWLIEVFSKCEKRFSEVGFFRSIAIMDSYFMKSSQRNSIDDKDVILIGITAIFLASKLEDYSPAEIKYQDDKLGHTVDMKQVLQLEQDMFSSLGFCQTFVNHFDFLEYFQKLAVLPNVQKEQYHMIRYFSIYIQKAILHDSSNYYHGAEVLCYCCVEIGVDNYCTSREARYRNDKIDKKKLYEIIDFGKNLETKSRKIGHNILRAISCDFHLLGYTKTTQNNFINNFEMSTLSGYLKQYYKIRDYKE